MATTNIDRRFNEILLRDIRGNISEAFLDLETNVRINKITGKIESNDFVEILVKEKANQMKTELNAFIDSQVDRIIGLLNMQASNENQVLGE